MPKNTRRWGNSMAWQRSRNSMPMNAGLDAAVSQIRSLMPQIRLAHAPCPLWHMPGFSQTRHNGV